MTEAITTGSARRPAGQVQAAWATLDRLYRQDPTDARVAGARAAAEWTLGHIGTSPVSHVASPAAGPLLESEGHAAAMVELGIAPGDARFARGVAAWMFWWIGLENLPAWLRP